MKRKLKLTKLTVTNLDHAKGGRPTFCACDITILDQAAYNYGLNHTLFPCVAVVASAECL